MPSPVKIEKVRALKERIQNAEGFFVADFRGLSVTESTELRRSLRDSGARFSVVKNTLMKRAAEEAGLAELERLLDGPTAVAFVDQDPVVATKKLSTDDLLDQFKEMSLLELSEFVKKFEETFEVQAAVAAPMGMPAMAAGTPGATEEEAEEKT